MEKSITQTKESIFDTSTCPSVRLGQIMENKLF